MVLGKLNLSNSSSNPRFGIRIDMVNRATNDVIHFGKIAKLLPFFASAGIKFIELGNLNSFDYQTGSHSSVFAKEPRLIPPEYLEQNFPNLNYVPSITQIKQILYDLISGGSSVFLPELINFEKSNSSWLQDYACFAALSEYIGNNKFNEWPTDIRKYDRHAIKTVHRQLSDNILIEKILQFLADEACRNFIESAHQYGIYVSADIEPLCDEHCCEAWSHHQLFYLNKNFIPSVYLGLPPSESLPHGDKSFNVPYRWQELHDDHFDFFRTLFSYYEAEFDYVHMLHGYSFFHYWEIAHSEINPKYGRWVPGKFDLFFGYSHEHFKKISYVFDFNEPLFPKFELQLKRCSLPQSVILGEPTEHICPDYDLSRPIQMICSPMCNTKVKISPKERSSILKRSSDNCRAIIRDKINTKIIHFDELCVILNAKIDELISQPEKYGQAARNLFWKPSNAKTHPAKRPKISIFKKFTSVFRKRHRKSYKITK